MKTILGLALFVSFSSFAGTCKMPNNMGSICLQSGQGYEVEGKVAVCEPFDIKLLESKFEEVAKLQPGESIIFQRKAETPFQISCANN